MPFRNPGLVIARILRLIGNAGQKIEALIDPSGVPRIDFYTGSANEDEPGSIFPAGDSPVPGQFALVVRSPKSIFVGEPPSELILGSFDSRLIAYNQGAILGIIHDFSGNSIEVGPFDFGGISYQSNAAHNFSGKINMDGIQGAGRHIVGFDCGEVSADTFGGNGMLNYPHNLGGPVADLHIVAVRTAAGSSYLTREPSNDTASTFRCQATLNAGGNPPNGTSIPCTYIGLKTV